MKKSLLALAVLGAFAGVASAQTNVTVYGLVDAGITYESGGAAGNVWKMATGVKNGSRLGFKGTEDLGGGLNAHFQLENGFDADTGALRQGGRLFGRQGYVGLGGTFGSVDLGRQYTPFFVALDTVDPFDTGLTGSSTNLMNPGTVRTDNAIQYSSMNMGGFTANVLYGLGEKAGNTSLNSTTDLSLNYANGPIGVYGAYDYQKLTPTNRQKLALLGGTYDFSVVKAYLAYETEKDDGAMDYRDWMVGVTVPLGNGTVIASYINKKDRSGANLGGKQYALGYTYAMSKRTTLYTSYGHIDNDANGTNFVGDASSGGSVPAAGRNSNAVTFGVGHKF
jgi:predicted porin